MPTHQGDNPARPAAPPIRALTTSNFRAESIVTVAALPVLVLLALTVPFTGSARVWTVVGVAVVWLPLTLRWRYPLAVLAVVATIDTIDIGLVVHTHPVTATVPLPTMLALYTVAARCSMKLAWTVAALVGAIQFGVALLVHAANLDWLYLNWAVVATVVGRLMKERRDRMSAAELRADTAERTKQAEAERQVIAERLRIARELHDVLAHHIAVINAQAGVAEYLLASDPAAAAQALSGITANSKAALQELRATLGLLRTDDDPDPSDSRAPAPSIEQLDRLLQVFTTAGMQLHVTNRGTRAPLSPSAGLAYYRIVQEALTNATKHAPGATVSLDITWHASDVALTITNGCVAGAPAKGAGAGYGLIGTRERAAAAGGSITSATTQDGGYRVSAVLPLLPRRHDEVPASEARNAVTP